MMEGVGLFSVVTLLVITISFDVTQACSCLPSTVQSDYCSASQGECITLRYIRGQLDGVQRGKRRRITTHYKQI